MHPIPSETVLCMYYTIISIICQYAREVLNLKQFVKQYIHGVLTA